MEKYIGKGKVFGALLTDLSKAFDCLDHELRTYKLNAYILNIPALCLIHDYLSNRKQKNKNWKYWNGIWSYTSFNIETTIVQYLFG